MEVKNYEIRKAVIEDCGAIHRLIQELANYEKIPDGPKINVQVLERDGFGSRPVFECFVAVAKESNELIGYALYFYTYSAWEGKCLYLEDIYVQSLHRGKKIGLSFFQVLSKLAIEENCCWMNFSVLNWNKPSIEFYKALGAFDLTATAGRHCFRLKREFLNELARH